ERSRALVGTQARSGQSPPGWSRSTTATLRPVARSRLAAVVPAEPQPRMTTSNERSCLVVWLMWHLDQARGKGELTEARTVRSVYATLRLTAPCQRDEDATEVSARTAFDRFRGHWRTGR